MRPKDRRNQINSRKRSLTSKNSFPPLAFASYDPQHGLLSAPQKHQRNAEFVDVYNLATMKKLSPLVVSPDQPQHGTIKTRTKTLQWKRHSLVRSLGSRRNSSSVTLPASDCLTANISPSKPFRWERLGCVLAREALLGRLALWRLRVVHLQDRKNHRLAAISRGCRPTR